MPSPIVHSNLIRVAIIDDHRLLVDTMEMYLHGSGEFRFAGSADSIHTGRLLIERARPDVLLLDIGLPDGDGLDLLAYIHQTSPETQVVVLTSHTQEAQLMRAIDSGVNGFVSKGSSLTDLMTTLRQAACGEIVVPTSLLIGLLKRVPRNKTIESKNEMVWEQLTLREREILDYLAHGKSGNAIADALNIAPLTVRTHVRNLMSKLGAHSRLEAVAFGLQYGLIEAPV